MIDESAVTIVWRKQSEFAWKLFYLSTLMALPAATCYGIGYPLACFLLAACFAYRAMDRWDLTLGIRKQPFVNVFAAVMLAVAWTVFSCVCMGLVIVTVRVMV